MPKLPSRKGLTGAHLLESQSMAGAPQTTEQKIRGGDARADWILLICGYDAEAVKAILADDVGPDALQARGAAHGAAGALYRLAYSLSSRDLRHEAG
jgi:hypothetical protein